MGRLNNLRFKIADFRFKSVIRNLKSKVKWDDQYHIM